MLSGRVSSRDGCLRRLVVKIFFPVLVAWERMLSGWVPSRDRWLHVPLVNRCRPGIPRVVWHTYVILLRYNLAAVL